MKHGVRLLAFAMLTVGVLAQGVLAVAAGAPKGQEVPAKSALVEKVKGGEIDWGTQWFYASGEGVMPSASQEPNRAKAYLKAKGYARMMAIANLLAVIEGTTISYEGFGSDYMAQDEKLRQRIEGFVKGVEILTDEKTTVEGDTVVKVTVGTSMYGRANPGTAFLERTAEIASDPETPGPKPVPVKVEIPKETPKPAKPVAEPVVAAPEAQKGPFTSLIVDARGYSVSRAISPKIRTNDGSEVWGTLPVTPDFAIETGIVSYTNSMELARKSSRCGGNPLILKAIGRAGGKAMCDPVISDEDAELARSESAKTKFMEQCKVIFIVDPPSPKPARK